MLRPSLLFPLQKDAYARLGELKRSDMPQVFVKRVVDDPDVPTGKLEFVKPRTLKPTQSDLNQAKVDRIARDWDSAGRTPVLISRNNWILDGHHRVAAAIKKGKLVRVIRIDLPGRKALNAIS
ncbi:MAG: hypothetical protein RR382_00385 [Tannerellaceae bacterium]